MAGDSLMKNTVRALTSFALLACLGAFAAPVHAQTLGEAAKREAARRARLTETKKVITNADLDALPERRAALATAPARPGDVLAPVAAATADSAGDAGTDAAPPAEPGAPAQVTARVKRDEQHWRERAQVIRERLTRLQSDAAALQGRVGTLNSEIDAAAGAERAALAGELRQTTETLARVQEELRQIEGEWRAFENRAAEAKIPPAWIR
jgi:hypothetical protein